MMKKVLATILAFIYLSTSMGATVHLHYCMGKLVFWGLGNHESKSCTFCGMPKKTTHNHCVTAMKNCCKDEHKQIKTDKDQKTTQSELQEYKLFADASVVKYPAIFDIHISSFAVDYPTGNVPPKIGYIPVFLLNCNFRI
jgi:hypothetical protein